MEKYFLLKPICKKKLYRACDVKTDYKKQQNIYNRIIYNEKILKMVTANIREILL